MGMVRVDNEFFSYSGPGQKAVQKDMTVRATLFLGLSLTKIKC